LLTVASLVWAAIALYGVRAGWRGIHDATADLRALASSGQDGQQRSVVLRRRRRFAVGLVCEILVALVAVPTLIPGTSTLEQIVFIVGLFAAAIGLATMMTFETRDREENRRA